jgi:hypothetical protein
MKKTSFAILLFFIFLLIFNPLASNTILGLNNNEEIIDQINEVDMKTRNGVWFRYIAQEFVPTNSILSKVEVALTSSEDAHYPVKISIRENLYEKDIVSTTISSQMVNKYPNISWIEFDFDDLQVTPGLIYYIIIAPTYGSRFFQKVPKSEHVYWMLTWYNNYTNGTSYISKSKRFLWPFDYIMYNHDIDFCFKTYTKINPSN